MAVAAALGQRESDVDAQFAAEIEHVAGEGAIERFGARPHFLERRAGGVVQLCGIVLGQKNVARATAGGFANQPFHRRLVLGKVSHRGCLNGSDVNLASPAEVRCCLGFGAVGNGLGRRHTPHQRHSYYH